MRMMGFLFLCLTVLAGVTIGTVQTALINAVVFLLLALGVARYLEPRFGNNGLAFGMAAAFFASFMWPVVVMGIRGGADEAESGTPVAQQGGAL